MADEPVGTPGPRDPLQQVLSDVDALDGLALSEQVAVYERIHTALAGALAGTVEQPAPGAGGR